MFVAKLLQSNFTDISLGTKPNKQKTETTSCLPSEGKPARDDMPAETPVFCPIFFALLLWGKKQKKPNVNTLRMPLKAAYLT